MSFAKTIEMSAESTQGFHDAVKRGVERATSTLDNVKSVWVKSEEVALDADGNIAGYRAHLKITFEMQ